MKPNRIILIRHGESEGNVNKKIYTQKPDHALNLTHKGQQQAIEAGQKLGTLLGNESVCFYTSPFYRARQTCDFIKDFMGSNKIWFKEDPRLREQEWATGRRAEAKSLEKKERDEWSKFYYRFRSGESCADVYDRVSSFLDTMFRDFEKKDFPENVIIVGHGMTNRVFLMRWFHWTPEYFEVLKNPKNCQYFILEKRRNGKYELTEPLERHPNRLSKF